MEEGIKQNERNLFHSPGQPLLPEVGWKERSPLPSSREPLHLPDEPNEAPGPWWVQHLGLTGTYQSEAQPALHRPCWTPATDFS